VWGIGGIIALIRTLGTGRKARFTTWLLYHPGKRAPSHPLPVGGWVDLLGAEAVQT